MDTMNRIKAVLNNQYANNLAFKKAIRAANGANCNIYVGPESNYRSDKRYFAQLNRVRRFIDDYLHDCYVDLDCDYISEKEPEGELDAETGEYIEPYTENTYFVSASEVAEILFGECSKYL